MTARAQRPTIAGGGDHLHRAEERGGWASRNADLRLVPPAAAQARLRAVSSAAAGVAQLAADLAEALATGS